MQNTDPQTVAGFGREWSTFDQRRLGDEERRATLEGYFRVFPWADLPADAVGVDVGCGSGRWAQLVAPRVAHLHLVDASADALEAARQHLASVGEITFHHASVGALPFDDQSLDFAYCLGVLHHVPEPAPALQEIARVLRPGAPLLLYVYYDLENRPSWYRGLWTASDLGRRVVSRLPFPIRRVISDVIALGVYWPLSRVATLLDRYGRLPGSWPLAAYRHRSLYTMRTDALDRMGTRLERRFARGEVEDLLAAAGFRRIVFSEDVPYWCVVARRDECDA